tara:strand:- start:683 stop:865 length:183 start_codon:yes stop_codon:yes gene_type:complete
MRDHTLAYSLQAVIRLTGSNRRSLMREIEEGRLKTKRLGRSVLIRRADLEDWLDGLPATQ